MATSGNNIFLVTGDVIADWMLAARSGVSANLQAAYQWQSGHGASLSYQAGGAALLAELIRAANSMAVVFAPEIAPGDLSDPQSNTLPRSFSIWQRQISALDRPEPVWRMHQFLGLREPADPPRLIAEFDAPVRSIVMDDAGLGFRNQESAWPRQVGDPNSTLQVVLKMAAPLCAGLLWHKLLAEHADRLTVYVSLGDLRASDAAIGQALSWEQLANDVLRAVINDPDLSKARRVVVSVGFSGAVMVEQIGHLRSSLTQWRRRGIGSGVIPAWLPAWGPALLQRLRSPIWPTAMTTIWRRRSPAVSRQLGRAHRRIPD